MDATSRRLPRIGLSGLLWLALWLATLAHPAPAAGAAPSRLEALAPPPVAAAAVYAFDMDADTPLYARNADERRPPGSTIKIATALVVVAHAELDERVVVDPTDEVDTAVFSHLGIVAGDTLTVEQLLYGLLVPSGSDAANALARHVGASLPGGDPNAPAVSRAAFVAAMNGLAADLGLTNTAFVNPTGDDAPGQYASARDLALLGAELLRDDLLAEIVRSPSWEGVSVGPEQRPFALRNVNQLLATDPAVIGVKTGATPAAGTCLVSARRIAEGNRVITVVLGSNGSYGADGRLTEDGRWEDTRVLYAGLDADYRWIAPAAPDLLPGLIEELAVWRATLEPAIAQPVRTADLPRLRYRLILGPEGPPGSQVGRVVFFAGSELIGERPVFQAGDPA